MLYEVITRSIGLGVMGESQMVAESKLVWGSTDHFKKIDSLMESISYNAIKASSNLAVEKGIYPTFDGSNWSKGIMPHDHAPQAVRITSYNVCYTKLLRNLKFKTSYSNF